MIEAIVTRKELHITSIVGAWHLVEDFLCDRLGLSRGQVLTLYTLLDLPIMDYEVVETLDIYPRSRMRKMVLDPLLSEGWIVCHSFPPANGHVGASRIAWSLRKERRSELAEVVQEAQVWAEKKSRAGRLVSEALAKELFGS